jgi:hypothetical protein
MIYDAGLHLPSAVDSSYNGIFTTVTQGIKRSSQTGFGAPLSDFNVRTLLVDLFPASGVVLNLKQLGDRT